MSIARGRVAIVTGGTSGIGLSIAQRFASEGLRIAVVGSSSREKAEAVASGIVAAGGEAKGFVCDVANAGEVARLTADVAAAYGAIDVLVNSAGVFYPTAHGGFAEADLDRMLAINIKGLFMMSHAVVPHMVANGGGKIVNLASVAGVFGIANYSLYCGTKHAVIGITKAMAIELAPKNINVNALAPGNTATPINADVRTSPAMKDEYARQEKQTPSNRVYSPPEEMAAAASFLISDGAKSMYGSTLLMDEGLSAGI